MSNSLSGIVEAGAELLVMEVRMWGPMASIDQKYVNGKGRNERREVRKQIGQSSFIYFLLCTIYSCWILWTLLPYGWNTDFLGDFHVLVAEKNLISASVLTNLTFGSASMKKFVAEYDGFMDVVIDIIENAPNLVPVSTFLVSFSWWFVGPARFISSVDLKRECWVSWSD